MFNQLQQVLQYQFAEPELLRLALTHSSAANELHSIAAHNERLEYLGDAVLELCVSKELYKRFPGAREGQLTALRSKLVNQSVLASLARSIKLDTCLILGKGEESQGGRTRDTLLSDAFEAILGAVFLDGGYASVELLVARLFAHIWPREDAFQKTKDPKSFLQEVVQQEYKERPVYSLVESAGPEHAKEFTVRLQLPSGQEFTATGSSVKRAEQAAALLALTSLKKTV